MTNDIELTILMPCLNEARTLPACITKAKQFIAQSNTQAEILIADNGSQDGSQAIAKENGARVIEVAEKGYGAALMGGIKAAEGRYVIMADADDSYDFQNLEPFMKELRKGVDLVIGNRFKGGIKKGAMPFLHRYLGNPVLSFIGKLFFKIKINDFHCGLRGFSREKILNLNLQTTGMEFASEMIVKASLAGYEIVEVPTILSPDGRDGPAHLNTWRDGWRHLRFLLIYSPKWLFLYPALAAVLMLSILSALIYSRSIVLFGHALDVHFLLFFCSVILVSFNAIVFYFLTWAYAVNNEMLPRSKSFTKTFKVFTLERGIVVGLFCMLLGCIPWVLLFNSWVEGGYGVLVPAETFRSLLPASALIVIGVEAVLLSFVFSMIGIDRK